MMSDDLLKMKLEDVSDLFLEKICESGNNCCKVDLPGEDEKGDKFLLRVCLCKDGGM